MLELSEISLHFPHFRLDKVSLKVASGEYFVLFGPTGSGKTLLFEVIAGLRKADGGTIAINGRDLTWADPACRGVGYVPQDLALIPFKTVWQNVAFGLFSKAFRPHGDGQARRSIVKERVDQLLAMLKIDHLADRFPIHLSGGEKQRTALGRALAIRPDILLLDEPLSAIDENTGNTLMRELKALQNKFKITTLHICHRVEEMRYLANRVAIIRDGALVQTDSPAQIGKSPADGFVDELIHASNPQKDVQP